MMAATTSLDGGLLRCFGFAGDGHRTMVVLVKVKEVFLLLLATYNLQGSNWHETYIYMDGLNKDIFCNINVTVITICFSYSLYCFYFSTR